MELKDVGNLPVTKQPISQTVMQTELDRYMFKDIDTRDRNSTWPMFITAGDISKDGGIITLRNYNGNIQTENYPKLSIPL